jgi:hypothetical protein
VDDEEILTLIFSFLLTAQAWGAVARDAETTASCTGCSSINFFHTTAEGSNRMIAVDVADNHFAGGTTSGITYN